MLTSEKDRISMLLNVMPPKISPSAEGFFAGIAAVTNILWFEMSQPANKVKSYKNTAKGILHEPFSCIFQGKSIYRVMSLVASFLPCSGPAPTQLYYFKLVYLNYFT